MGPFNFACLLIVATTWSVSHGTPGGHEIFVPLTAPLAATKQSTLSADDVGWYLAQIDEGKSNLSSEDQRLLLESALLSLVQAHPVGVGDGPHLVSSAEAERLSLIEQTYFQHLEGGRVRTPNDPILGVVAVDGFLSNYTGMKLVALHDRLNLGWSDQTTSSVLPTLLRRGAERAADYFLKHGHEFQLNNYVRMLAALKNIPELTPGPKLKDGLAEFLRGFAANVPRRLADSFDARVYRPIDFSSFVISTAWLSALAVLYPVAVYQALVHGPPAILVAQPAAFLVNSTLLIVFPALLNVVSRGRMRERRQSLEVMITRFEKDCARALGSDHA